MTKWQQTLTRVSKRRIGNTKGARLDIKILFVANRGHEDNEG
jgi:hypothetical protein